MKNNLFKFVNGKFIMTEGYGSVKKIVENKQNPVFVDFFRQYSIPKEQIQELFFGIMNYMDVHGIQYDYSLDPANWIDLYNLYNIIDLEDR